MIRTLGELLACLRDAEVEQIERVRLKHPPTIGEMYEGLTSQLLETGLPAVADLKVASGFVEDGQGGQSGQIDCMLVSGKGAAIPHTNKFSWNVRDVHAVLEVKKRLFSQELADAHGHLRDVLEIYGRHALALKDDQTFDIEPSLHAFGQITGRVAPAHRDAGSLPFDLEMLYRTLIIEQLSPVRIVFGYHGYGSEFSFRQAFIRLLRKNLLHHGFGVGSFPQLAVSGKYSLVKLNGHPYSTPMRDGRWLVLASSSENPLVFLLQLIWTRLSYRFQMPPSFYGDLDLERVSPLLSCRIVTEGSRKGWKCWVHPIGKKLLMQDVPRVSWRPFVVTPGQFTILNLLCRSETLPLSSPVVRDFEASEPTSLSDLFSKRLIAREGTNLVLLTRRLGCVIMPTGELIAGDDSDGRLTAWVQEQMAKTRASAGVTSGNSR
jgi:Domain of unknown function (DUF6602)